MCWSSRCLILALYYQLSEWIKVYAGVFIYMLHYLVIKRWKLGIFLRSNLENKLKLFFTLKKEQGRMRQPPRAVQCTRVQELVARMGILLFSSLFQCYSVLKWLETWDEFSPTCIVFKKLIRIIDIHSSYLLILHVVSCFAESHDLAIKRLKTLTELHDSK